MSALKQTVLSLVGPHLTLDARVASVIDVSENFRFIDIEAELFKKRDLQIGEKVQINIGDWLMRTYTPLSINQENGRLGVLAYLHGNGPGSQWARKINAGDRCQLIGPHASLKLPRTEK
ncbi:MAG TPA: siderophore-interacting protein, partial [Bdellovibrionales bacterium]|nr:siderophore-interacting protein [Bdellovibrionales bacterium]